MKQRRETSFRLAIISQIQIEKQYEESMFSVRILVSGMTKRIVLEEISRKTFLLVLGVILVEGNIGSKTSDQHIPQHTIAS
jgi:hypothetical protein